MELIFYQQKTNQQLRNLALNLFRQPSPPHPGQPQKLCVGMRRNMVFRLYAAGHIVVDTIFWLIVLRLHLSRSVMIAECHIGHRFMFTTHIVHTQNIIIIHVSCLSCAAAHLENQTPNSKRIWVYSNMCNTMMVSGRLGNRDRRQTECTFYRHFVICFVVFIFLFYRRKIQFGSIWTILRLQSIKTSRQKVLPHAHSAAANPWNTNGARGKICKKHIPYVHITFNRAVSARWPFSRMWWEIGWNLCARTIGLLLLYVDVVSVVDSLFWISGREFYDRFAHKMNKTTCKRLKTK